MGRNKKPRKEKDVMQKKLNDNNKSYSKRKNFEKWQPNSKDSGNFKKRKDSDTKLPSLSKKDNNSYWKKNGYEKKPKGNGKDTKKSKDNDKSNKNGYKKNPKKNGTDNSRC